MQPFVVPPACSPRPPLIRLNKAVLPPHRHFSDAPITLLRNYINAKIPVADAHFIPFCIFPSISPKKPVSRPRPAVFIQQHWDGRLFTASAETCESCEGWVLVHKESSPLSLSTHSSDEALHVERVQLYCQPHGQKILDEADGTTANLVYLLILQRQIHPLSRLFPPFQYLFIHPRIRDTPSSFRTKRTSSKTRSLRRSLLSPSKRNGGDTSTRKSKKKRKRRYSCQPADFAADSALREADERAVALDAAVAVLSEPEQILVNTEELVKNWKQSTRDRADQTPTTPGNRGSSASPPAGSTTPSPHSPQRVSGRAGLVRCEEYRW
ncbi:hypothetical protein BLNAU_22552 [Blattamonas nauphoetae]|uniref:Uncharacterized protein n=1 Tax=Blattamonas nauphoetae TaxID=2049346 RepID=A0ABQ9WSQ3_9EUKA|nr:hypothetical protein BLNAU_22552 [Blattamonas nauphoetae]